MKKNKKKKTAWDIVKNIIDGILTVFVILVAVVEVASFATKGSNYGTPSVFGMQTSIVVTDSMAKDETGKDVYPVGTGIICNKIDFDKVQVGDDILFYGYYSNGGLVTIHRVFDKGTDTNGNPYYLTRGINTYDHASMANQFQKVFKDETSPLFTSYKNGQTTDRTDSGAEVTAVGVLMGKLNVASIALGNFIKTMQTPYAIALLIIIPCLIIAISSVVDIVKIKKTPDAELEKQYLNKDENTDAPASASLDNFSEEEKKKLKEQMMQKMLDDMNKKGGEDK